MVEPRAVLRSYSFLVASLMFGLPLLISYYSVSEGLGLSRISVIAYLVASLGLGFLILLRGGSREYTPPQPREAVPAPSATGTKVMPYLALAFGSVAVVSFGLMKSFIASTYPYPSPLANVAGGVYVVALGAAAAIGFPILATVAFPFLRQALADRRLLLSAIAIGIVYFVTYEVLVNEIVVTGYNTAPGNFVTSPTGIFPWAYVFTSGPTPGQAVETAIYTPYVLVQLNQYVNFIFQPFELALAIAISVLVSSAVVSTYHLVRRSEKMGGACSASATLSGVGAFLGYTATCPSCLAPTLVSVVFGGLATVQTVYSNLWGAVVPPVVSVLALVVSMYVVGRGYASQSPTRPG
jgi:hypothetical protein